MFGEGGGVFEIHGDAEVGFSGHHHCAAGLAYGAVLGTHAVVASEAVAALY